MKPLGLLAAVVLLAAPLAFAERAAERGGASLHDDPVAHPPAGAGFEEVSHRAGVARLHTERSFDNPYARIMEGYTALGAAVAAADYDGDGFEDLFVTDSETGKPNLLYHNDGDFTFTEVGRQAGVADGNDAANATAAALWFDYDDDGRPDLLVVRFGRSLLYHNRGDGTFEDVTARAGLARYANSITAIAFDYDGDGDLDLFVGDYFGPVNVFHPATPRFFPESFETAANGGGVTLYQNQGDGTFRDVTDAAGLRQSGWTLDLGHADYDGDGDQDLYVASDFGTDRFFVNNGDGTFTDATRRAIGIDTKKGMNADWGDYDNDGRFDVFVTNITDEYMREGNFLWHNNGDGTFTDVARETGTFDSGWGWAGKFFDYDNDGWLDLYAVDGWVSAGPGNYVLDIFQLILKQDVDLSDARNWPPMGDKTLSGYEKNRLFHNHGGVGFTDEAPRQGVDGLRDGRGVAVADFDNDGRLDLFVSNAGGEPYLFRNRLETPNHWLELLLAGTRSNRDAVGARVRITAGAGAQVSFVNGGNGFASQSSRRLHFGLGPDARVERLEVSWPSGATQTFSSVAADQIYRLTEGSSELEPLDRQASDRAPDRTPHTGTATAGTPRPPRDVRR